MIAEKKLVSRRGIARRILYVLANAEMGGVERVTLLMIAHHRRSRYEPVVLFLNDGSLVSETRRLGVRTHVLSRPLRLKNPWQVAQAMRECARTIRTENIDLVHSSASYSHLIASWPAWLTGRPCMLFQHGPVGGWIDRLASALRTTHVVTNSRYIRECQERIRLRRTPTTVIHCATDLTLRSETIAQLAREVDTRFDLGPEDIVIGMMARFEPWKGVHVAIRAMAPILRDRKDVKFLIVGGQYRGFHPEYSESLKNLVREEGVESGIIFTGFTSAIEPFLARMDVLVHASTIPEPFGLVIIEGMAAGKAVIASRAGGATEIITENEDGFFHTPGDEVGLRDVIRKTIEDRSLREAVGSRARDTVARRFTPEVMMNKLEGLYDRLLVVG